MPDFNALRAIRLAVHRWPLAHMRMMSPTSGVEACVPQYRVASATFESNNPNEDASSERLLFCSAMNASVFALRSAKSSSGVIGGSSNRISSARSYNSRRRTFNARRLSMSPLACAVTNGRTVPASSASRIPTRSSDMGLTVAAVAS